MVSGFSLPHARLLASLLEPLISHCFGLPMYPQRSPLVLATFGSQLLLLYLPVVASNDDDGRTE